jgi:hypothetical protein
VLAGCLGQESGKILRSELWRLAARWGCRAAVVSVRQSGAVLAPPRPALLPPVPASSAWPRVFTTLRIR